MSRRAGREAPGLAPALPHDGGDAAPGDRRRSRRHGADGLAPQHKQVDGMERVKEEAFLYLTATGRRSGLPREIEIWFTRLNGRYYVIAERGEGAQWVRNLLANPRVQVRIAGAGLAARARVVDPAAEPGLASAVQTRSREKYRWGDGLIVELEPLGAESARSG